MEIYHTNWRPSMPLAYACAPSAAAPITAAKQAPLSQVHQVQIQAELARTLVPSGNGGSISGFVGGNGTSVFTDGEGGAPPRGRPV